MPQKHDKIVRKLLFELATWHSLAKLQLNTESTLNALENLATRLGNLLRIFKNDVCSGYVTRDLPSEEAARGRRRAAIVQKVGRGFQRPPKKKSAKKKNSAILIWQLTSSMRSMRSLTIQHRFKLMVLRRIQVRKM